MSMLSAFIENGRNDLPVYITDVRRSFLACPGDNITLVLTEFDGGTRQLRLRIPESEITGAEAEGFIRDYIYAEVYNLLSALGGERLDIYTTRAISELLHGLRESFGFGLARKERTGYGRCVNVIERMLDSKSAQKAFDIQIHVSEPPPEALAAGQEGAGIAESLNALFEDIQDKVLCGVDIGGTDIKLCAAVNGKLLYLKEYDWNPALFTRSSQLINPILLLVRLLRARVSCDFAGIDASALDRVINNHISDDEITKAVEDAEAMLGDEIIGFDSIGLCFPDVVIGNKIVGGEASKTNGIRNNPDIEYEAEFRRLTDLDVLLLEYCAQGGRVRITNDGPMAAFTAAMELLAEGKGETLKHGRFAHTLGTDLGTGWLNELGEIPAIPLEIYNFIIDLGSNKAREYHPDDLRSIRNFNTNLPGTIQRLISQSGVFRMAVKSSFNGDGSLYKSLLESGYIEERDVGVFIPFEPRDMRKPLLERLMKLCAEGNRELEEVFLEIGRSLGITFCEAEHILAPKTKERVLYGRLVKLPRCFELIAKGAAETAPSLVLSVANEQSAYSSLMKQLKEHPFYTVAQFAQSVGALYYGRKAGID